MLIFDPEDDGFEFVLRAVGSSQTTGTWPRVVGWTAQHVTRLGRVSSVQGQVTFSLKELSKAIACSPASTRVVIPSLLCAALHPCCRSVSRDATCYPDRS